MRFGTEKAGSHGGSAEGATALLEPQGADGSWKSPVNTFARLFLRRATRSVVESADSARPKK